MTNEQILLDPEPEVEPVEVEDGVEWTWEQACEDAGLPDGIEEGNSE